MKIKKEFIPLILNGKKKYEFRKWCDNFDSIFLIEGKQFILKDISSYEKKLCKIWENEIGRCMFSCYHNVTLFKKNNIQSLSILIFIYI